MNYNFRAGKRWNVYKSLCGCDGLEAPELLELMVLIEGQPYVQNR